MELLQLRYFQVVARVEHMTKAAAELHIAQPSLSKTIRRLEDEVGVPLFDRQGRSIRLNHFGRAFLASVDSALRDLEEGQRKVRAMVQRDHGRVAVAAASLNWLPPLLDRFTVQYPTIEFHLSQCAHAELVQRLESGQCDFCFTSTPVVKPGIEWHPLRTHELLLIVSPKHHLAQHQRVPWCAIAGEAVVVEKRGTGLRDLIDDCCRQADVTPRIAYEINEPTALFEFVKANLGIGFAPASVKPQVAEHRLVALHLTDPICMCTFGIAWHHGHPLPEAARAFRHFVLAQFARAEGNGHDNAEHK